MTRKAIYLVNEFVARLKSLETTRGKIEQIASNGLLVRRDVEKVYEALYLRSFTYFESLIEDLFLGMLMKKVAHPSGVVPRVQFRSDQVAREVVYAGRSYVDWFPYYKTEHLSEVFFRGGRPFTNLEKTDKQEIEKLLKIRNAIAHNSPHAIREFLEGVVGSTPLTPREKTPAGFLRSHLLSVSYPQTRYEYLTIEMVNLARKICSKKP